MRDLFIEIGVEELPADYIPGALASLEARFRTLFEESRISLESRDAFATPRRLTLCYRGVAEKEEDRTEKITGPPRTICFKEGKATKAYEKFLEKNGLSEDEIFWEETDKGPYLTATRFVPGRPTREIIQKEWPRILDSVEFPKKMRWSTARRRCAWRSCRCSSRTCRSPARPTSSGGRRMNAPVRPMSSRRLPDRVHR